MGLLRGIWCASDSLSLFFLSSVLLFCVPGSLGSGFCSMGFFSLVWVPMLLLYSSDGIGYHQFHHKPADMGLRRATLCACSLLCSHFVLSELSYLLPLLSCS